MLYSSDIIWYFKNDYKYPGNRGERETHNIFNELKQIKICYGKNHIPDLIQKGKLYQNHNSSKKNQNWAI